MRRKTKKQNIWFKKRLWSIPLPLFIIAAILIISSIGIVGALNGWFGGGGRIPADTFTRGLVGYWSFDEGSGITAYDGSGYSNNGTLTYMSTNTNAWTNGKVSGALRFDGVDDYVQLPDNTSLQFGTGDFTFEMWMNTSDWSNYMPLISNAVYSGDWDGIIINQESQAGKVIDSLRVDVLNVQIDGSTALSENTWYHVAVKRDSGNVTIYINGTQDATSTVATGDITSGRGFMIGRNPDTTYPRNFAGLIDDVRIYNRALSAAEVRYHYNRGGPIAHWKLDEGSGSTAYDSTENNNDGTLYGEMATSTTYGWVAGKYGSALAFDGVNDYVEVTDNASLDITDGITLEAWVFDNQTVYAASDAASDADITINSNVLYEGNSASLRGGPFWTSPTVGYIIFLASNNQVYYQKTDDGGATWTAGSGSISGAGTWVTSYDAWADWQTPGDDGTKIHIVYSDSEADTIVYAYLDTSDDSHGTDVIEAVQGTGALYALAQFTTGHGTITKTVGGNLAVAFTYRDTDASWFYIFYTSPDGDTWTSRTSPWESATYTDFLLLFPANLADTNDLWGVFWDYSANILSLKTFDNSAQVGEEDPPLGTWSEADISPVANMLNPLNYMQMSGVIRFSDGHLLLAAWRYYDNSLSDLLTWDITDAGTITAKTDVITNEAESFLASCFCNQNTDDWYVAYLSGTTAGSDVHVQYQLSQDGGANWDGEVTLSVTNDDHKWISAGAVKAAWGGKFQPIWKNDDLHDLITNVDNGITIVVDTTIVGKGQDAYQLQIDSSLNVSGYINNQAIVTSQITQAWHHVALTYNRSNVRLYVDGNEKDSYATTSAINTNSTNLKIGDLVPGKIDDVRLYNYARTPEEIRLDYNAGFGARFGPMSDCDRDPGSCMTQGLVSYWDFEEGSGSFTSDRSGQGSSGTLTYMSTSTNSWTSGIVPLSGGKKGGGALQFDGADDYVDAGNVYNGVKGAELWIKADNTTKKILGLNDTQYIEVSDTTITATGWILPTIYVNGVKNSTTISTSTWSHVVITTETGINATSTDLGRYSTNYFDGTLDEVKLYSRALSAAEVRYHYNRGGPIAHWKMDEGSGSTAYDSTENNNDGTLKWMSTSTNGGWVTGKYGSALAFDGVDDYVEAPDSTSLDITDGITLEGWMLAPVWACGDNVTFIYKGAPVTYGSVTNNGECWLDRNLGATSTATAYDDADGGYGDLFQWGRLDDQHQIRTSGTTIVGANNDVPGHSNFITTSTAPYDWRNGQNDNLWQGVSGINNPCPSGWRIPTEAEWETERLSWSFNDHHGAYASPLKLTAGGNRLRSDALIYNVGSNGYYWSSTISTTNVTNLIFSPSDAYIGLYHRSNGFSVRCVQDDTPYTKILSKGDDAYSLRMSQDGSLLYGFINGVTTTASVSTPLKWHHYAMTYDGSHQKLYIDANLAKSSVLTGAINTNATHLKIGDLVPGKIDDVRIYNYARTPEEIRLDYNAGFGARFGPMSDCDRDPGSCMTQGLAGYWNFEEGSGSIAYDASDNGKNGEINNCAPDDTDNGDGTCTATFYPNADPETSSVDGIVSQEYSSANGETWYTIRTAAGNEANDPAASGQFIILWTDSVGGTPKWRQLRRGIFLFDTSELPNGAAISAATLSIYGTAKTDGLSISPDVNVYSATPNSNTALVTSDYAQTGGNTPTALATAITYIGWNTAGYNDWTFNASGIAAIDVLGVSKFSVRNANYDAASSTPSWGAGSSSFSAYYADQTGTAQDPKLVVTYSPTSSDVPDWTTGKKGGALEFDGSDAYVSIGDVYNGVKSAEFWIKTSSSTQQVLDLNGSAYIELSSNTITATGWTSPTIFVDGVETSTITANTWHHVVITTGTGINASTVSLGRVSTNYFDGTLDEVKLYSRALSASEVRYYYNRGGPVAHWKMDEGSASTAYDSTENNNDGTLKWMSTSTQGGWVEGKYGSALSFDGTDDYVDITDVSGQVRTISFWVKRADGSNKDIIDLGTPEIKVSSDAIISTGLTSPTYYVDGSRSTALSANVWHHVVIIDTANINASDVDIGKASSNYFYGLIDDVRVYEYVRTQEQIRQDYNAGLSTYFR